MRLFFILFFCFFNFSLSANEIENRVSAFIDDDQYGKWFTFSRNINDHFTLSFAGSGSDAGIWIVKGISLQNALLDSSLTYCQFYKNDGSNKLQNLIKELMNKYSLPDPIKVNLNANGKRMNSKLKEGVDDFITDPILLLFLKEAQNTNTTEEFLKKINFN